MNFINEKLSRFGVDWFLPAIIAAIALAYLFPTPGIIQQPISLSEIANYGVSAIFFFYGLKLNTDKLKSGLANWRMHLVIQLTTFLIFPLLALMVKPLFNTPGSEPLWPGIFFLASLPSTVSSSVVMVSLAGGNIPAAIFNASISALIGILITPLWIGLFLQKDLAGFDMTQTVLKLTLQVLVPVILGILLNKHLGQYADKHKKALKNFDQVIILLIIYTSFCKSFTENLFSGMSWLVLVLLALGMLMLFAAVLFFTNFLSRVLKFSRPDQITVMFCGSKKSLVHGTVMAGILFAGNSLTGFILLPLMLYHALQLIASSILAKQMALSSKD